MAEIVNTLFGVTPESYRQAQQQQADAQALQYAKLDPFQQANYAIGRGANMLGGAIGGALGGQDPELQRITRRQQIAGQLNPNDLSTFEQAMAALAPTDPQGAMMVRAELEKIQMGLAKLASENALAGQRQAASVASLAQANRERKEAAPKPYVVGNALVSAEGVELYKGPDAQKYSGFAQELIDAGLTPGTEPFQNRMLEYVTGKTKGAAKGTGNVIIGGITVDTGEAAKKAGGIIGTNVANIEQQYGLQTAYKDALTILNQGIYGGAYGPEKQFLAKYVGVGDPQKVQNTEVFLANIGEIVIPRLVQFGGNDSNEELKYLQKVVAGDQRLEPEAIKRILVSAEKKVQNNIKRLSLQTQAAEGGTKLPIAPITPPAQTPTKRWNPQTRKLETVTGE
jgi:hypothetical protein